MDGYKLASVAGMVTMGASVFVEYSLPTLAQVGQPQTQPGQAQPERPGQPRPGTAQPGRGADALIQGGAAQPETTPTLALFALRDPGTEQRLTELRTELERIEKQMRESNARLVRQLGQVRLLDGERKVDALVDVVQAMLEEHVEMEGYLTRVRESLTGRGTPGSAFGIGEPEVDDDDAGKEEKPDDEEDEPETPAPGSDPLKPR